ncbi:MAG: glycosyltransferase family 4 protein [Patescibacteria group bacterium]
MKILVIAPTPFFSDRGTHIRILEEALALEKRGHTVTIVTYHIGSDLPESLHSNIDVRRILRLLFWYKKLEAGPDWQKIILDLMLVRKAFFLARTTRPDIIHGHLHEGVLIGFIVQSVLFWRKMKLVGDFHGSLTKEMLSHDYLKMSLLQRVFQWVERWIDNLGDAAVASSWDNAEEINRMRKKNRVTPLLDGTRLSMFEGIAPKSTLREEYGVPENKVIVTYTGALIPNKGIKLLLEAVPVVCAKYPDVHFVIAGFPVDQITEFLEQDIFKSHVTVISPLSYFELPKVLKLSDIGVDPKEATTRQASGKTLQYMGAGLPVACFDTENNREYLGEGGTYAREITSAGLAEAIGELVGSPELRAKRGSVCRERAEEFSWEKNALHAEALYNHLLEV